MTRTFDTWEYDEIETILGYKRVRNHPLLNQWLAVPVDVPDTSVALLLSLQERLLENADAWNEDELKMFFIAPFLSQVPLYFDDFKPFMQRTMSATFPELNLHVTGKVEFFIARGKQRPRQPYFFLHEYKQERRRETDPLGQLLIAMIAAQTINEVKMPLYGCYVIGRNWFFVIVNEREYSVSLAYDATKLELYSIYAFVSAAPLLIKPYL